MPNNATNATGIAHAAGMLDNPWIRLIAAVLIASKYLKYTNTLEAMLPRATIAGMDLIAFLSVDSLTVGILMPFFANTS